MIRIKGRRIKGIGEATNSVAIQIPHIAAEFPEIAKAHPATINLELDLPLIVLTPDHRTRVIDWDPKRYPGGEVFDLLRIELEAPLGARRMSAWLYIAHRSDWRKSPQHHEIIAPRFIRNLRPDSRCRIIIYRDAAKLPYRQWPAVVV